MEFITDIVLLGFLVFTAIFIARTKCLFSATMMTGIYSLVSAGFFVVTDAVDVAFTEASVGAGISTLLLLSTLTLTGRYESPSRHQSLVALIVVTVTGALLLYGIVDMPLYGSAETPVSTHLNPYFIEKSGEEIGIPNIVTSVLASYRGFDTFGETVVIFTAGIGVLTLLGFKRRKDERFNSNNSPMHQHKILRVISKMFIPPILLFALYVQFHGDFGPGGGFQAGVIFAAAIILYAMLFGLGAGRRVIHQGFVRLLAAIGVLIYGSVGLTSMLAGKNFLDYSSLAHDAQHGQHLGILLVEAGVGITVASVMITIFFTFAGRADMPNKESL